MHEILGTSEAYFRHGEAIPEIPGDDVAGIRRIFVRPNTGPIFGKFFRHGLRLAESSEALRFC